MEACLQEHGAQTTNDLIELLSHIHVKSENLPTLDELTAIVQHVAENDKPKDYSSLEQGVKDSLPQGVAIQIEKVVAVNVEPAGNLQAIIAKHMHDIMEALAAKKALIDSNLGEGFFDSLATAAGPAVLLKGLEKVGKQSGLIGGVAQGMIIEVMLKVYESVLDDGLARIGIKDKAMLLRLAKIINNKISHPIKSEKDFKAFTELYANQL